MKWLTKTRVKYALAGVGAVYAVLFIGYLVYAGVSAAKPKGPSELEAHPERAAEIKAMQRAEQMQERLGLSDEQTLQIADIFFAQNAEMQAGMPAGGPEAFMERMQAVRDQIKQVLTPEQLAEFEKMGPGGMGGPGFGPGGRGMRRFAGGPPPGPGGEGGPPRGPGGPMRMSDERKNELKAAMTPEQQERFENSLKRMEEHRRNMPFPPGPPPM